MSISYDKTGRKFSIQTKNASYFMQVDNDNVLRNLHWGEKISCADDVSPEISELGYTQRMDCTYPHRTEYIANAQMLYDEPCINAEYSDGTRDIRLVYSGHSIHGENKLSILLKDEYYPLEIELNYITYGDLDLISKNAVIKNKGSQPIRLTKMKSGTLYPTWNRDMRIMHFVGNWGAEYQRKLISLNQGRFTIDNRRGTSSGPQHVPFFALDEGNATETDGRVWYGSLHWSGNFKIDFEHSFSNQVTVTAGVNDFDCEIALNLDEQFETPLFTIGFTDGGYEKVTETLYDFQFDFLAPQNRVKNLFPVVYNTWYPYHLGVDEEKCLSLIERASHIGAELFVIDDGWFDKRTDFFTGLGDWYCDTSRFPNGLKSISDKAHEYDMKFGLWIEPEMVNENSELYKTNPDWILSYKNRKTTCMRHQYVLNLARKDVKNFVWETVDRVISEYGVDYLKWDMNRYIAEAGAASGGIQKEIWIKFIQNLYDVWEKLNRKYPDVLLENCAHGGARADYGTVGYCDIINRSDNFDPVDVLKLHEGFSMFLLPKYAGGPGNLATSPNGINNRESPLKYRACLGMTGIMSIGVNLLKISEAETAEIKSYVAEYKRLRGITQNSYVYRLSSAFENPYTVWEYLSRDRKRAVVFVFAHGMNFRQTPPRMKLRGLEPDKRYKVSGEEHQIIDWKKEKLKDRISYGDGLMHFGIRIEPLGDYDCQIIEIEEI